MVIASYSGRQLAAYAFGASKVIWVVGAQKIVTDLDQAFVRIEQHYLPLESQRLQEVYGQPSSIGKELVIHGEQPGRITMLLLEDPIGFEPRSAHLRRQEARSAPLTSRAHMPRGRSA